VNFNEELISLNVGVAVNNIRNIFVKKSGTILLDKLIQFVLDLIEVII